MVRQAALLLWALWPCAAAALAAGSQCHGTVSKGRIENSVKLPASGRNFSAYSALGVAAGRTHVHSKVADVLLASYEALAQAQPSNVYVYGETGWPSGGRIRPHRTHQNGLSVDFFVLDPAYLPRLFATERGPFLRRTLPFMKGQPWVRHDEHYHVDFSVPCKPGPA
jgi:murein endopeptidase